MTRILATIAAVSLLTGCASHHAVVVTGIDPGPRRVEDKWADSYLDGAVAPDRVDAGAGCGESGVAIVETRVSFMNQLVTALTLGIYSPMEIIVTCGSAEETDEPESEHDAAPGSPSLTPDGPKKRSNGSGGG